LKYFAPNQMLQL